MTYKVKLIQSPIHNCCGCELFVFDNKTKGKRGVCSIGYYSIIERKRIIYLFNILDYEDDEDFLGQKIQRESYDLYTHEIANIRLIKTFKLPRSSQ